MDRGPLRRALAPVSAVLSLLLLGGAGLGLHSEATGKRLSAAYSSNSQRAISNLGICARASLAATVSARASTAPLDVIGWHGVRVAAPKVTVDLTDCATGKPVKVDTITLTQMWQEKSCRMSAQAGSDVAGAPPGDDDDDPSDWWLQSDFIDCAKPAAVGTADFDHTAQASLSYPDQKLDFSGRTWGQRLCLAPQVYVQVARGDDVTGAPLTMSPACVDRH